VGEVPRLGDPLLDEYLRFVAARARPNTLAAQAFDLKVLHRGREGTSGGGHQ
jgi:integrase/recombinase XerD